MKRRFLAFVTLLLTVFIISFNGCNNEDPGTVSAQPKIEKISLKKAAFDLQKIDHKISKEFLKEIAAKYKGPMKFRIFNIEQVRQLVNTPGATFLIIRPVIVDGTESVALSVTAADFAESTDLILEFAGGCPPYCGDN